MGWIQQVLRTWLGVPSAVPPQITSNLQQLENRLTELEKMVMTQLQRPDSRMRDESVDESRLADLPDAHLGAQ